MSRTKIKNFNGICPGNGSVVFIASVTITDDHVKITSFNHGEAALSPLEVVVCVIERCIMWISSHYTGSRLC